MKVLGANSFQKTLSVCRTVCTMPLSNRQYGVVLSPHQAIEIYACKLEIQKNKDNEQDGQSDPSSPLKGRSASVAKKFDVSAKTVRDVWSRRTWAFATSFLWQYEGTDYTTRRSQPNASQVWLIFILPSCSRFNTRSIFLAAC